MFNSQEKSVTTLNDANFGKLRAITQENGNVWFCLVDVCRALNLSNPRKVRRQLGGDGVTTSYGVSHTTNQYGVTTEQRVQLTFINEPNLYRCIFQSRKAEAVRFQD